MARSTAPARGRAAWGVRATQRIHSSRAQQARGSPRGARTRSLAHRARIYHHDRRQSLARVAPRPANMTRSRRIPEPTARLPQASCPATPPYRVPRPSRCLSSLRTPRMTPCHARLNHHAPITPSTFHHLHHHQSRKMRWRHCNEEESWSGERRDVSPHIKFQSISGRMAFHSHQCRILPYQTEVGMCESP